MSAVIKSSDAAAAFAAPSDAVPFWSPAPPSAIEQRLVEQARLIDRLQSALEARDTRAAAFKTDLETARRQARAEGHADGLSEGTLERGEAVEALRSGVQRAVALFEERLSSVERLAALVAREGLERILGDSRQHAGLLAQSLRHQLKAIESRSLLGVQVSALDFPDRAGLDDFARDAGLLGVEVEPLEALQPGECRLVLTLGSADVGVSQQWSRLSPVLAELAEPAA